MPCSDTLSSVPDPGCLSRIPDPTFFHPGSRIRTVSIPDPGSSSKNLSILTPKKPKTWFLSSRKYDPVCSSRIRMQTFYPSRIPDPGVKKAPDPGSRIRIRNTVHSVDMARSSKASCCLDTSRCSTGRCSVDTFRSTKISNGYLLLGCGSGMVTSGSGA